MLRNANPQAIQRLDYQPSPYLIDRVDLTFELDDHQAIIKSRLIMQRQPGVDAGIPLVLNGEALELLSVTLDGARLESHHYELTADRLTLHNLPASFILELVTRIEPQNNTTLMGLYQSNGNFFTQCEAEGFRRITYYLDRPDVMARFTTTIIADKNRWPVLLSNGNRVGEGQYDKNRHWVKWVDPFRKPAYLFALVAGKLSCLSDQFTTRSGKVVDLEIYVEPQDLDKCPHAMSSVKKSMKWDEDTFGLEYDLDVYMIVAVSDFNMGAMENKGLNIFNTKYVLAKPETATDTDFDGIEAVIAHEYFHNWTGNRVTCRDWFQLSLKEGLTVFRDQEFSADMGSRAVKRIDDVRVLRTAQFAEDAGPMAHPVRPDAYIEINNFYTVTIYEKGAEVVRMYQTLLGKTGFRKGMDLYFRRHDGQAVTCDDFRAAMADANEVNLDQFERWYTQAGTPVVTAHGHYNAEAQTYTLELAQHCPDTPGQNNKQPFLIPVAIGLIGHDGLDLPLQLEGEPQVLACTRVLNLTESNQRFTFINVPSDPVPSLLRNFSAPVKLVCDEPREALVFRMRHDSDAFNQWEAAQTLSLQVLLTLIDAARQDAALEVPHDYTQALAEVLQNPELDPALIAQMLHLPAESYLADQLEEFDPDAIRSARDFLRLAIARALRGPLLQQYDKQASGAPYSYTASEVARRSLRNTCLSYLSLLEESAMRELAINQYRQANNMTDQFAALAALADFAEGEALLLEFASRWEHDPLVMDKWFALQATSRQPNALGRVESLMSHSAFALTNPNKVRALLGSFLNQNLPAFHAADNRGYAFAEQHILALDKLNPQIAARLAGCFNRWKKLEPKRRELAHETLVRIRGQQHLSPDLFEIVTKNLD